MPTPKRMQTKAYWKREWLQEKARGKNTGAYMEREKARDAVDAAGVDRKGKHVDHVTPIVQGGKTTKSNIKVVSAQENLHKAPHRGKQITHIPPLKRK